MNKNSYDQILSKRGSEELWLRYDPVLADGQECFVSDRLMTKHGDGIHKFSELPYDGVYTESTLLLTVNPENTIYRFDELNSDSKTVEFTLTVTGVATSMIDKVVLMIDDRVLDVVPTSDINNDIKKYTFKTVKIDFGSDARRTIKAQVILKSDPEIKYDSNEIIFNFLYPVYSGPIDLNAEINKSSINKLESSIIIEGNVKYVYTTDADKKGILFAYPEQYGSLSQIIDENGFNLINDYIKQNNVDINGIVYSVYLFKNSISDIENFNITYKF